MKNRNTKPYMFKFGLLWPHCSTVNIFYDQIAFLPNSC